MRRLTLFITLLLLLTACGKMPEPQPTLKPTLTPDTYQLVLGNIHAQSTLEAVQATAQSILRKSGSFRYCARRLR